MYITVMEAKSTTITGNNYILVISDTAFHIDITPIRQIVRKEIVPVIKCYFRKYGIPKTTLQRNGSNTIRLKKLIKYIFDALVDKYPLNWDRQCEVLAYTLVADSILKHTAMLSRDN